MHTIYVIQKSNKEAGAYWPTGHEYRSFATAVKIARRMKGDIRINEYNYDGQGISSVAEVWSSK